MGFFSVPKDPEAVLDYGFDWSAWLADEEIILLSTWSIEDDDTMLTIASDNHTDTTTTVWLSGGVVAARYVVVNHITTDQGREDDRSITIKIKER